MGLRDDNQMVDSDLDLIITAFEKAMVTSRDVDSVLVPFRREISAFSNYPQSIVDAIDGVPTASETEEGGGSSPSLTAVPSLEAVAGDPNTPVEDGDDDDSLNDKIRDWVTDCVPCTGKFKRTVSSMDADFFKDIGIEWDRALEETWDKLIEVDDFLLGADITTAFCDMAEALKGHCGPDLEKMSFILKMMLERQESEFGVNLNISDTFLMAALSPIFNGLAANLDLIATLAIEPIKCVLDYIEWQINNRERLAGEARAAILDPVKRNLEEKRLRFESVSRTGTSQSSTPSTSRSRPSEAERAAATVQREQRRRDLQRQSGKQYASARQKADQAFNRTKDSLNYLDRFQEYLSSGTEYLEEKKDWLQTLIEEFINDGLDRWNDKMSFAKSKNDLLTMSSVLGAMIDAGRSGDLSCGPESGGLTSEDVQRIVRHWVHPSESLEIVVEDGNIVTRRRPDSPSNEEAGDRGVFTGAEGSDVPDEALSNVVVRRPISSCLKKITTDEAEQVQYWIRQLEQEV